MISYQDRLCVISGAAGGIGSATAVLLARLGARLVLLDHDRAALAPLLAHLPGATGVVLDIADAAAVRDWFGQDDQPIGCLVNNAAALGPEMGPEHDRDVETTPASVWHRAIGVNLLGTVAMCRHALGRMRAGSVIINVASNLALQGNRVQCAYSATKAAVIQLTRSIAASHGHKGIRCNAVLPGLTMTPSVRAMPEAFRAAVLAESLLPEPGTPEDLAQLIAFLGSDAARNITGQAIVSDGGLSSHVPGLSRPRGEA